MNTIKTHSYKNWTIEIHQKQSGGFGYHCHGSNAEESRNDGYDNMQDAVDAAQNYIDQQTGMNSAVRPTKEVGSPTEDEGKSTQDLNDLWDIKGLDSWTKQKGKPDELNQCQEEHKK